MSIITVRNVPDTLVESLKQRAALNHRSLQGEVMAILEQAAQASRVAEPRAVYVVEPKRGAEAKRQAQKTPRGSQRKLSLNDLWQRAQDQGLATPSESAALVREERDRR